MKDYSKEDAMLQKSLDDMIQLYDLCYSYVFLTEPCGKILRMNRALEQRLGEGKNIIGKNIKEVFPNVCSSKQAMNYLETCEKHKITVARFCAADGLQFDVELRIGSKEVGGNIIGICMMREYYETDAAQIQVTSLEPASKITEPLIRITHDFKTPLHAIRLLADSLETDVTSEVSKENIQLIMDCCDHMTHLITQILEHEKLCHAECNLNEESVNLYQLIEDTIAIHRHIAEEKGIQLMVDVSERIPKRCCVDQYKLVEVIGNLLSNGVKYTPFGVVYFYMDCVAQEDNVLTLICMISDTGDGIEEEQMVKIFEPYMHGEHTHQEGTGLGLAITKKLIQRMSGRLVVKSEVGKGSQFIFFIKVKEKSDQNLNRLCIDESTEQINVWIREMEHSLALHGGLECYEEIQRAKEFGTKENRNAIIYALRAIRESVLVEEWEKTESRFHILKYLIPKQQSAYMEQLMHCILSARKKDAINTLLCIKVMEELIQKMEVK